MHQQQRQHQTKSIESSCLAHMNEWIGDLGDCIYLTKRLGWNWVGHGMCRFICLSWLMYVCGGVRNEMSCGGGGSLRRLFGEVVEIAKYIIESKQANKHKRKSSNISNRKWNQRRSTHILLLSITTTMSQNISIAVTAHVASLGLASFSPIKEYGIMHNIIPTILGSKFGHSLPPSRNRSRGAYSYWPGSKIWA